MEENQVYIPDGWHLKQVQEFAVKMRSGGTPKSDNPNYYNGEIPFVAIDDLTSANKYLEKTQKHITKEGLINSSAWLVPINSLMYSIYETLGVPRINLIEAATNQAILNLIPDTNKITLEFLYYLLLEKRSTILAHSAHTTQSNLNAKVVKELEFVFPKSTTEQTTIANILSKTDQAIADIEALITKYTQIKAGLMQDLLTKGIDENGNIRSEQTHKFKDSPLGRIPQEWASEKLSKYGFFTKGYSIAKSNLSDNGVSCVLYGEIYTKYNFYADTFYSKVPYEIVKDKTPLEYGDILFAGSGETHKDIGKCIAFIGSELTYAGGDIIIFRTNKFNPIFLSYFLNSFIVEKQKAALGQGSSVIHIYPDHLKQLIVVHFDIEEQNKIVEIIKNADKHISTLKTELSKLLSIKTGLMQDLLTGKVRVEI